MPYSKKTAGLVDENNTFGNVWDIVLPGCDLLILMQKESVTMLNAEVVFTSAFNIVEYIECRLMYVNIEV